MEKSGVMDCSSMFQGRPRRPAKEEPADKSGTLLDDLPDSATLAPAIRRGKPFIETQRTGFGHRRGSFRRRVKRHSPFVPPYRNGR
jgi:hypothetical protein